MLQKTRCVIFDCEGTLVDSETLCCRALVDVFSGFGCEVALADALRHFQGGKPADILTEACQRYGLNVSVDELEPRYRDHKQQLYDAELRSMPGVVSLLDDLREAGIALCIAGNSEKDRIEHALALTDLSQYFPNAVFSAFEANSWKPEPDLLLYTAMNMGFMPSECVYVDDTLKGVKAGIAAGMRTYYFRPNLADVSISHPQVSTIMQIGQLAPEVLLPRGERTV